MGRGPATKVADSRVSRKQLALVADTQKCRFCPPYLITGMTGRGGKLEFRRQI